MIFNVQTCIVTLVEASDPDEAMGKVTVALHKAGFEIYEGQPQTAFESDEQNPPYEVMR